MQMGLAEKLAREKAKHLLEPSEFFVAGGIRNSTGLN